MGKLGQKIEHIDNATNEIMDEIRDVLNDIAIEHIDDNKDKNNWIVIGELDDKIYSIIHNKLKKTI